MVDARQTRAVLELMAHLAQSEDEQRRAPRVLSPSEDLAVDLVRHHRLGALAFRAGYDEFRDDYAEAAVRAPMCAAALARAIAILAERGVDTIVRGAVGYQGVLYDDIGERPVQRVLLLVRAADLASSRRALAAIDTEVPVELTDTLGVRVPIEETWARALPAIEREDGALRLDPVDDAVVHLAAIADRELMVPAIRYVDAVKLLRRRGCNRRRVRARAAAVGLSRSVAAAIAMTDALAAAATEARWPDRRSRVLPPPAEVIAAAEVPRRRRALRRAALAETARDLAGLVYRRQL